MKQNKKKDKKKKKEDRLARSNARAGSQRVNNLLELGEQMFAEVPVTHILPRVDDVVPELPD